MYYCYKNYKKAMCISNFMHPKSLSRSIDRYVYRWNMDMQCEIAEQIKIILRESAILSESTTVIYLTAVFPKENPRFY